MCLRLMASFRGGDRIFREGLMKSGLEQSLRKNSKKSEKVLCVMARKLFRTLEEKKDSKAKE